MFYSINKSNLILSYNKFLKTKINIYWDIKALSLQIIFKHITKTKTDKVVKELKAAISKYIKEYFNKLYQK